MSDSSVYHLLAFTFTGKDRTKDVVKELVKEGKAEGLKTVASVAVSRDEKGKVKFSQIRGMSTKKGVGIGVGAGALLAILGSGGVLLPVVAGGAAGGVLAKHRDKKELSGELQELTEAMANDSSALLAVVRDTETEDIINEFEAFNANVITVTLGDEETGLIESMLMGEFEIDLDKIEE